MHPHTSVKLLKNNSPRIVKWLHGMSSDINHKLMKATRKGGKENYLAGLLDEIKRNTDQSIENKCLLTMNKHNINDKHYNKKVL